MSHEHDDDELGEVTAEERAEAEALRHYVDGRGAAPSTTLAGTVGLVREAGSVDAVVRDAGWRAVRSGVRRQRAFWPVALPASLAAAAVIAFFLWPRAAVLPPGPSVEQLGAAVRVLSSATPIPQRLGTLHEVAGEARRRLVAEIAQREAQGAVASGGGPEHAAVEPGGATMLSALVQQPGEVAP